MARIRIRTLAAGLVASGTVAAGLALGAPAASADQIVLACNASAQKATLNPPVGSGSARYFKSTSKSTGGASCLVDAGISTDDPSLDGGTGKYRLDNQTGSHTSLTVLSSTTVTYGSATCNSTDPANVTTFPTAYPGQGKLITKFVELDELGKQIQLQAYIRMNRDPLDPDPYHGLITGMVIKGVGLGGNVHAVVSIFPDLTSTKNLNLTDCIANPAVGNASIAVMDTTPADGSDADTDVDPWTVSLPS